ncbi:hypothetical protein GCM10007897_12610 [Sphingobium jiangsuense]|uniref:Uncharacterized protein n=1 Tax=Sphingobium jiangsuense TaxID=870476 RepID=A0A7W6FPZ6_9SPHN|nr:hypothetical protein [Sphingobium jiangsuense]MBB3925529.1 hypothetical protein [Sphingobium jiangsuense]GLS99878.1 hypothetical protein GCM10007897_12610 [Sphingobium jiangsuense]
MSFTQLDPPIPLEVLDKGKGLAIGLIDYGPEHNLIWVTAIDATGEIWCAPNPNVRMRQNWTMGRPKPYAVPDHGCAGESATVQSIARPD